MTSWYWCSVHSHIILIELYKHFWGHSKHSRVKHSRVHVLLVFLNWHSDIRQKINCRLKFHHFSPNSIGKEGNPLLCNKTTGTGMKRNNLIFLWLIRLTNRGCWSKFQQHFLKLPLVVTLDVRKWKKKIRNSNIQSDIYVDSVGLDNNLDDLECLFLFCAWHYPGH